MNIRDAITERARERAARENQIIVRELPDTRALENPAFVGGASIYMPRGRTRYIKRGATVELAPGVSEILSHPPRDYFSVLRLRGEKSRTWSQQCTLRWTMAQPAYPNFAIPAQYDDGYYIDISRCYFAVLLAVGWNVAFHPGKFLLGGYRPFDFPFLGATLDEKRMRSMLVTLALPRGKFAGRGYHALEMTYPGGEVRTQYIPYQYANIQINALLREILHVIAANARALGAVWGAMDGYVCPTHNVARDVTQMIHDHGLDVKIKARGAGEVRQFAARRVGDWASARMDVEPRASSSVREIDHARWLSERFAHLAALQNDFRPRAPRDAPISNILDRVEV